MKKLYLLLIICCYSYTKVFGQGYYSELYGFYTDFSVGYNHALIDTSQLYLQVKHKQTANNVYNTSFRAHGIIKKTNFLGIYLNNLQEGPYISSPRAYLQYANSISLNSKNNVVLSGLFGYQSFNANLPTKSYAFNLPDGSLSLTFNNSHYHAGVSVFNIFGNNRGGFWLRRYGSYFAQYNVPIRYVHKIELNALLRHFADIQNELRFSATFCWYENLKFGAGIGNYGNINIYAMPSFILSGQRFRISVGYNSQFKSSIRFLANSTEIGITWLR